MTKSKYFEPLAVAVAGGSSIKAAAAVVGCSTQTAYNLTATPEWRQRVSEIRSELTAEAVGVLTKAATAAAQTLVELLSDDHEAKDRLAAARLILSNLGPISEIGELRQRIADIENRAHLKVVR